MRTLKDVGKKNILFDIKTHIGFSVHCTKQYWEFISLQKHPSLKNHLEKIKHALSDPDEIRRSKKDKNVYLFYRGFKPKWICAVAKDENGNSGFLITAYHADAIKVGDVIWTKSK